MQPIEGSSPDPVDPPSGCSYHPRCPLADDRCLTDDPEAYEVTDDHSVDCHYWQDAATAVPVSFESDPAAESDTVSEHRTPRAETGDPVVSMRDVEVHFEEEGLLGSVFSEPEVVRAVDGVDLDVYENDVIVMVGESGCGKTTLGKTGVALQEPTDGTVEYRNQDVWEARNRIGNIDIPYREIRSALQIIHQDPGSSLNSMRRVKSTLEAPLKRLHGEKSEQERLELMLAMLEYVGMTPADDYIDRYPHQLSGGEKQRVALVRAMLMNPDVILADEPISALDVSLRVEMMDLMIELQDRFDTSYLFVSHDLSNARYIAGMTGGRIAVMYLGEVVEAGTVDQIINDPRHPYTQALRWATPELDPDSVASGGTDDAPMRQIDIPDPTDPPRGCRYHTRCPKVIPPEAYDFEQSAWNAVMDLKVALERDDFDRDTIEQRVLDVEVTVDDRSDPDLRAAVRDYFDIPEPLGDPDAEDVLVEGFDRLADDDADGALELFDDEFPTVCQTRKPATVSVTDETAERGVACFLETDETA